LAVPPVVAAIMAAMAGITAAGTVMVVGIIEYEI
jgi:hypothetical protein